MSVFASRAWVGVAVGSVVLGVACGDPSSVSDEARVDSKSDAGPDGRDGGSLGDAEKPGTDAAFVVEAGADGAAVDGSMDSGPPPFQDDCAGKVVACPTVPVGFVEGSGLRAVDRCAYPMKPVAGFGSNGALLDALERLAPKRPMATVLADTNRIATQTTTVPGGPPGIDYAFRWNAEDDASETWIPQGITGTADADVTGLVGGKRAVLVSFYEDAGLQKGVRIAITDVTNPAAPRYRFALLVEPSGTVVAPTFAQVDIHAGGIVWYGTKLYVAQTGTGFRVFDMSRILEVAVDTDTMGCTNGVCRAGLYKYVIPQIGVFADTTTCGHIFSWVSLDRSSSPPSLVSGEYCSTAACTSPLAGKVFRWPLDASTGLLRGGMGVTWPTSVAFMSHRQVQGGAYRGGVGFFSSSAPAGGGGALYRVVVGRSATSVWGDAPEDLMVDEARSLLWSLSEAPGSRTVFAGRFTSYPAP